MSMVSFGRSVFAVVAGVLLSASSGCYTASFQPAEPVAMRSVPAPVFAVGEIQVNGPKSWEWEPLASELKKALVDGRLASSEAGSCHLSATVDVGHKMATGKLVYNVACGALTWGLLPWFGPSGDFPVTGDFRVTDGQGAILKTYRVETSASFNSFFYPSGLFSGLAFSRRVAAKAGEMRAVVARDLAGRLSEQVALDYEELRASRSGAGGRAAPAPGSGVAPIHE